MKDFLGQELRVGDYVVYSNSYVQQNIGQIAKINPKTIRIGMLVSGTLKPRQGKYSSVNQYSKDTIKLSDLQLGQYLDTLK